MTLKIAQNCNENSEKRFYTFLTIWLRNTHKNILGDAFLSIFYDLGEKKHSKTHCSSKSMVARFAPYGHITPSSPICSVGCSTNVQLKHTSLQKKLCGISG